MHCHSIFVVRGGKTLWDWQKNESTIQRRVLHKGKCTNGWKGNKLAEQEPMMMSWAIQPLHKWWTMLNKLMIWFKMTDCCHQNRQKLDMSCGSIYSIDHEGLRPSQNLCKVDAKTAYKWELACMETWWNICSNIMNKERLSCNGLSRVTKHGCTTVNL